MGSLVLILDGAKGYFSAMIGYHLGGELGMMIGFVVAIVGHSKSWMLHFKGGKGIATAGGALLYVSPITLAILLVILGIIVGITKYMSLAPSPLSSSRRSCFILKDSRLLSSASSFAASSM